MLGIVGKYMKQLSREFSRDFSWLSVIDPKRWSSLVQLLAVSPYWNRCLRDSSDSLHFRLIEALVVSIRNHFKVVVADWQSSSFLSCPSLRRGRPFDCFRLSVLSKSFQARGLPNELPFDLHSQR